MRCACRGECGRDHANESRVIDLGPNCTVQAQTVYDPDGARCAADAAHVVVDGGEGAVFCGACRARLKEKEEQ